MAAFAIHKESAGTLAFPSGGISLEATLFCGQSFVWRRLPNGRFAGVAGMRPAEVWLEGDTLLVRQPGAARPSGEDEAFWRRYFALDTDYAALQKKYAEEPAMAACVAASPGLRLLRQPFYDTLLSFIVSQNNNIARITAIVTALRRQYGPRLPGGGHALPLPKRLAALRPDELQPLRAGYRAAYLVDAAARVADGRVSEEALRRLPNSEARALLCTIKGVGPKVADCVLLYGLGRDDVVPMDVWMKRAMTCCFPGGMPGCCRGSEGIAQQYIFCWARGNLK